VVAGHLDGGEEVKHAMMREAREEIGIQVSEGDLEVVGVMHRLAEDERIDFFLMACDWEGEIHNMEPHRCDDLAWFPLDRLPVNMIPYVERAIQNYQRGGWFDSFGFPRPTHPKH
jgi:ADP-ribose pyrophosphatase YjhB (NUDIX family)